MRTIKILITCLTLSTLSQQVNAQQQEMKAGNTIDYNNISMPESPSAAAFGKAQEISVNTATGVPNISIPLYTFEMDGVKVPISISYNASGIKVGDMATSVGLGWSLDAGGQFTRTVRAKADEFDGILTGDGPITDDYYAQHLIDYNLWQKNMKGNPDLNFKGSHARKSDHYPDQFSYSFLGNSGSFIHNPNALGIIKDKTDGIKIEWDENFDSDFKALDLYGNTYQFFYSDTEKSNNINTFGVDGDLASGDDIEWEDEDGNIPVTAWKLSKIETKNNKVINFQYQSVAITPYTIDRAESHITIGEACWSSPPQPEIKTFGYTNITYNFNTQLIKKISSPDGNIEVNFHYETDTNISTPGVWLTKLDKIVIVDNTDPQQIEKKEFHFVHSRFSGDPRLRLDELYEVVYDANGNPTQKPGYIFSYNNGSLPPKDSFSQDFFGYFNNKFTGSNKYTLVPHLDLNPPFDQYFNDKAVDRSLNLSTIQFGILKSIQYPTGGSTLFEFHPNEIEDKYCGGLRIKKIENVDETGTYSKITYQYSGLNGFSLNDRYLTYKTEGNAKSYYASFVAPVGPEYKPGYFYDKVTVTKIDPINSKSYKEEHYYEENYDLFHKMDFALQQKKYFIENQPLPIKEETYINQIIGEPFDLEWNILGDMKCYKPSPTSSKDVIGYNENPIIQYHRGNFAFLPTKIITTDYLDPSRTAVTTIKEIEYDPNTLLKVEEITDTSDEIITTSYYYPSTEDGFPSDFPKGLLIKKEVSSNKSLERIIFGQAMEYDAVGNVIKSYSYNKGEIGNTSSPSYVPNDYEEMTSFLYENGKPVQVWNKSGEATTYIWGLKGQFPVAKIEGKTRAGINQTILQAVENATYAQLPGKLDELRNDLSVDGAMLTTYTYKPLAGVETITDPKGDKMTFHYDAFGRLDYVEDRNGNILSENEYHYRLQP